MHWLGNLPTALTQKSRRKEFTLTHSTIIPSARVREDGKSFTCSSNFNCEVTQVVSTCHSLLKTSHVAILQKVWEILVLGILPIVRSQYFTYEITYVKMVSLISIYKTICCPWNLPTIWTWSLGYNYLEHCPSLWNKNEHSLFLPLSFIYTHIYIVYII